MKLHRIHARNFRAIFNICLDVDSGLTLITGPNGAGKSTLFDALRWCLWGERTGNQADLIREGSEWAQVDVWFSVGSRRYKVSRSHARGRTFLQVDEILEDQDLDISGDTVKETQVKIVRLIGTYDQFQATSFVRQKDMDRFLSARPAERKEVLAAHLGIPEEYAKVAEAAQRRVRMLDAEIGTGEEIAGSKPYAEQKAGEWRGFRDSLQSEVSEAEQRVNKARAELERLQQERADLPQKVADAERDIERQQKTIEGERQWLSDAFKEAQDRLKRYDDLVERYDKLTLQIEQADNDPETCQTCGQTLQTENARQRHESRLKALAEEAQPIFETLVSEFWGYDADYYGQYYRDHDLLVKDVEAAEQALADFNPAEPDTSDLDRLKAQDAEMLQAIHEARSELTNTEQYRDGVQRKLAEAQAEARQWQQQVDKAVEAEKVLAEKRRQHAAYDLVRQACSKDGVPQLILDQALAQLHDSANRWLSRLLPGWQIEFRTQADSGRETLEETILTSENGIRSYADLGRGGQAALVSLAVRLGMADLASGQTGVHHAFLILDEPDDALKPDEVEGQNLVDNLLGVLREASYTRPIIMVSHHDAVRERCDQQVRIVSGEIA